MEISSEEMKSTKQVAVQKGGLRTMPFIIGGLSSHLIIICICVANAMIRT